MDDVHPDLLRALVAVADTGSFTQAARDLGLRQSTVSQQVARLESALSRRLLDRDTHRVAVTPDGEAVLDHARRILDANGRLHAYLAAVPLRGRLRLGASEDFILSALPDVLAAFVRRHAEVDLELTAGLSQNLYAAYDAGLLDILFAKKRLRDRRGTTAWREPLAWVGRPNLEIDPAAPLPLLLYPPPSVTRALATDVLDTVRRSWRTAFTSTSLSGLGAAARAGIGLMPHSGRLIPPGLVVIPPRPDLPPLPDLEFVVIGPGGTNVAAAALIQAILEWAAGTGMRRG